MKHPIFKVTVLNILLVTNTPAMADESNPETTSSTFPSKGERVNAWLDRLGN
ncbi:MAG: hypothetical protein KAT06_13135 [Gammaproteobacteria bacterium]|nr:hypothetical protein [Gammaproteobacteria bacterium]